MSQKVRSSVLLVESTFTTVLIGLHSSGSCERVATKEALRHLVEGVSKAEISVQHHLFVGSVCTLINQLPLVLLAVTTHVKLGAPSSSNHSMIVVVVEEALVFSVSPVTFVARVSGACTSDGVSARDGSR